MGNRQAARRRQQQRQRQQFRWIAGTAAAVISIVAIIIATRSGSSSTSASATNAPFVGGDMHSLVADPTHPGRLFVGGHEAVAVSNDKGHSWQKVTSLDGADAMGWAFVDNAVWLGGHPGLRHSTTDNLTFNQLNTGLPNTDIHALGGRGTTLYAASPIKGLLTSSEKGGQWEIRNPQDGTMFMGRILVDPKDNQHLVAPDMSTGATESLDGGRNWHSLGGPNGAMWVSWAADNPQDLIVSGANDVERTDDAGKSWQRITVPAGVSIVEANPTDSKELWAASHNGSTAVIWHSIDSGTTWQPA